MKNYRIVFREADRARFDELVSGAKTIEARAATAKYRPIQAGDSLSFVCGEDELTRRVDRVDYFGSLDEMFGALPLNRILPSAVNLEEAKEIYYSFPGYKEKIESVGILAFSLVN